MGFFINPSLLPGGREWVSACAAAADAGDAAAPVRDTLACASGSTVGGLVQVLMLMGAYGFVLYTASGLIAEGSELLLLVPSLRGIVGSVVLPVLGAIPDGCIVFFSGLGENAQEEISIGVGALAGSTTMLLTVPWFISVLAGRVNIRPDGTPNYTRVHARGKWAKLMPPNNLSPQGTGVSPKSNVASSGVIMLVTAAIYIVIQVAAFSSGNFIAARETAQSISRAARFERVPAALCFLIAMIAFAVYIYFQISSPSEEKREVLNDRVDNLRFRQVEARKMSLSAALKGVWTAADEAELHEDSFENTRLLRPDIEERLRLKTLLGIFFDQYDLNKDKHIQAGELKRLMLDLGEHPSVEELNTLIDKMGGRKDKGIDFERFVTGMGEYIRTVNARHREIADQTDLDVSDVAPSGDVENMVESEDEEDVPEDLKHPDPDTQIQNIKNRSFTMMAVGTALVLVFSDPMVDVLGDVGARIGVPAFYISFIMAPLASNASELFAAYQYAKQKTRKSVTISFSTLLGAAILNNTFVLAIFMALIVLQGLAWTFSAETISIIFVEACMFHFSQKRVMTLADGYYVLSLFPASLLLVAFLENVVGLD